MDLSADAVVGKRPSNDLIAARLRMAAMRPRPNDDRQPWFALEHVVEGDLGHLHATHDLRDLRIESKRALMGPAIVRLKRAIQRSLHPLQESQSVWNGANARVVTFLLRQLSAQARAIEKLEDEVARLSADSRR
jgi:hypothetical protein